MIERDTIRLLRECDAGIKMGIASIDDVLGHVKSKKLCQRLADCKTEHGQLQGELQRMLEQYRDEGKDPNPIAKGMSWMKTNMKLGMEDSDATIADGREESQPLSQPVQGRGRSIQGHRQAPHPSGRAAHHRHSGISVSNTARQGHPEKQRHTALNDSPV